VEILSAHAFGAVDDERQRREIACVMSMIGGNGDDLIPPPVCPNCGDELHLDQTVCANCGYIRPSSGSVVPASSGVGGTGGALIGCGGAFVAVLICMIVYGFSFSTRMPAAVILLIEAMLAIGCFLAFRALMAQNRYARESLIAFVIVFVVLGGGLGACVGMFSNFNVH
jgi:hypothetical protein